MPNSIAPQTDPIQRNTEEVVVFPPVDLDELLNLARFLELHTEPGLLLGPDGEQVPLPLEVYQILVQVAESMRQGKAISVMPRGLLLTTQEAANLLGISRPTLVKLLESGEIPYEKPNRHRRVKLDALMAFQSRRRAERRALLNRMTENAQDGSLYDGTPSDYLEALREVRHEIANTHSS
jgi:excisionase family DNA binding protein